MLTLKMCKPEGLLYFLTVSSEPFQGAFSQVGAGAVVTKSFPDHSIVTGVPAALQRKFE
jgi:carbonic anhydrase/acetyltransferase-like protein (isoleucine patch superfamily)